MRTAIEVAIHCSRLSDIFCLSRRLYLAGGTCYQVEDGLCLTSDFDHALIQSICSSRSYSTGGGKRQDVCSYFLTGCQVLFRL